MRSFLAAVLVTMAACGGSVDTATGVVIDVRGGLTTVEHFTLISEAGVQLEFEPEPGATFDGGPLGHLRDHLRSGQPVEVLYRAEGGILRAIEISDTPPSP